MIGASWPESKAAGNTALKRSHKRRQAAAAHLQPLAAGGACQAGRREVQITDHWHVI